MLETSGRATLTPRTACGIESAARNSGLPIWLLTTSHSLRSDHLPTERVLSQAIVRRMDPLDVATGTPLERVLAKLSRGKKKKKKDHLTTHLSDILRWAKL